jgi:hypothetical protein
MHRSKTSHSSTNRKDFCTVGKTANKKREELFKTLEREGKIKAAPRPPSKPRTIRPKVYDPSDKCCVVLFANKLPDTFMRCHGCPLDPDDPRLLTCTAEV